MAAHARCPTGAVQGAAPDDCFALVSSPSGWYDAEEACVERGGHLASVTSAFANAFVRQQAKERRWDDDFWVGGSNDQGNWTWSDGGPF
ncbi:Nattectin precursor, partial [Aphelenchoides avenae]